MVGTFIPSLHLVIFSLFFVLLLLLFIAVLFLIFSTTKTIYVVKELWFAILILVKI